MIKLLIFYLAQVAQLVEQATENRCVGGSIPPLGTTNKSKTILNLISLISFSLLVLSCNQNSDYFPDKKGARWDYKILIDSDYTGSIKEKRISVTNVAAIKHEKGIKFSKLYSNGNLFTFFKDKKNENISRVAAFLTFDEGFDEPVKKEISPSIRFEINKWKSKNQLYITKGFQPPLRGFKPTSVFDMEYSIISSNVQIKVEAGIFKNCAYIKGKGETEFIADTRSGAIKVKINTQEWICPGIGLVKEERIESTNASAFGTQKYHKELIDYNI